MQASYAANGDWQGLMKYNKKASSQAMRPRPGEPAKAEKAAPPDDLTQLAGIGRGCRRSCPMVA